MSVPGAATDSAALERATVQASATERIPTEMRRMAVRSGMAE